MCSAALVDLPQGRCDPSAYGGADRKVQETHMTFSTLMVHLELEHPNDARLQITGDLAEKFNAKVIGIAAADPQPPDYAGGSVARGFVKHEQIEVKKRIEEAEARFRSGIDGRARDIEWR